MKIDITGNSVLSILHSNYLETNAGIEKVVLEQQKICESYNLNYIAIFPKEQGNSFLNKIRVNDDEKNSYVVLNGIIIGEIQILDLLEFIENLNIRAVIIHQLIGYTLTNEIISKIKKINIPIYYYIHDYATICFNHTLLKNNRYFCGVDGVNMKKCYNCRFWIPGVITHNFYKRLFDECDNILFVFPSHIVKDIWTNVFSTKFEGRSFVIPNQKFSEEITRIDRRIQDRKIRIAYIGYQNRVKGWNTFKKIHKIYNDKYEFYVLGSCSEKLKNVKIIPVSFTENGQDAMVDAIRDHDIDITLLWSIRPETYGYTFFESYIAGSYVLTNECSGNISHMTKKLDCGKSFKNEEQLINYLNNESKLNEELLNFKRDSQRPKKLFPNEELIKIIQNSILQSNKF